MENKTTYLSMEALAAILALPQCYLRGLVENGSIPSLNVNGRRKFNLELVQKALAALQKGGGSNEG